MTPLPDVLPIKPFTKPAQGEVTLPGSKSITNRALLLAALCDGPVTLTGALFSEDTEIMAESLRRLGFNVEEDEQQKTIYVEGRGGKIPNETAKLFVGNAGTAARFLTALCAAAPRGTYKLDGIPQMRKRPMKGLLKALEDQGAKITYHEEKYFFPFTIEAHGLKGGEVEIDASESSQMLSALLMVESLAGQQLKIEPIGDVRLPFVEMTKRLMSMFDQLSFEHCGHFSYPIEADATAASYFLTLPLTTIGSLSLPGFHTTPSLTLQGDSAFAQVLNKIGMEIQDQAERPLFPHEMDEWEKSWLRHVGTDSSFNLGNPRKGVTQNFNEFSDTFLTLAAISPLLEGQTKITGIAHTRKQETDRVAGAARELKKLGQEVIEEEDSLTITPNLDELKKRAAQGMIGIETYNDHRFAMSFAILGCYDLLKNGKPWLSIKNPACCAKTFPNFFDVLEQVWKNSHQK